MRLRTPHQLEEQISHDDLSEIQLTLAKKKQNKNQPTKCVPNLNMIESYKHRIESFSTGRG